MWWWWIRMKKDCEWAVFAIDRDFNMPSKQMCETRVRWPGSPWSVFRNQNQNSSSRGRSNPMALFFCHGFMTFHPIFFASLDYGCYNSTAVCFWMLFPSFHHKPWHWFVWTMLYRPWIHYFLPTSILQHPGILARHVHICILCSESPITGMNAKMTPKQICHVSPQLNPHTSRTTLSSVSDSHWVKVCKLHLTLPTDPFTCKDTDKTAVHATVFVVQYHMKIAFL